MWGSADLLAAVCPAADKLSRCASFASRPGQQGAWPLGLISKLLRSLAAHCTSWTPPGSRHRRCRAPSTRRAHGPASLEPPSSSLEQKGAGGAEGGESLQDLGGSAAAFAMLGRVRRPPPPPPLVGWRSPHRVHRRRLLLLLLRPLTCLTRTAAAPSMRPSCARRAGTCLALRSAVAWPSTAARLNTCCSLSLSPALRLCARCSRRWATSPRRSSWPT